MDRGTDTNPMPKPFCVDAAPVHLIRVTPDGRISDVSSAAGAVLRRPAMKARIVGEFFIDTWVAEEDRAMVRAEFSETLRGASPNGRIAKAVLSLPSGSWKTALFMAASRSDAGSVDGVVIVVQDHDKLFSFFSSSCAPVSSDSNHSELAQARDNVDKEVVRLRSSVNSSRQARDRSCRAFRATQILSKCHQPG